MRRRTEAVLETAWTEGVRWFDVARSYGRAEEFVGDWLRRRGVSSSEVAVSSKWGYRYVANWQVEATDDVHEVKEHTAEHFAIQLAETVESIGEYVRLYQIHSATMESGVLQNGKVLQALHACRQEHGWTIGLSLSSPTQSDMLRAALAIRVQGEPLFSSCQVTYNLLEQGAHAALMEAHRAGLTVVIKEGVANGRLLSGRSGAAMDETCAHFGCSRDQLALACILAQEFEPFVLSGAVTRRQLLSNLQADEIAEQLKKEPALLAHVMKALRQDSETYWSDRAALKWN
jgi:aryl-alcohol dehydrogenase-like predicted oxidoreductase